MGRYNYTKALGLLVEWAEKAGYSVFFTQEALSYIEWKDKTLNEPDRIMIEAGHSKEIQVYLLLHELGHHQLRKDWDKFTESLPIIAYAEHVKFYKKDGKYKRRVDYNISCLEEEFKAWDEGYKLGKRLGLRINIDKWQDIKAKCILTYVRYYGGKK